MAASKKTKHKKHKSRWGIVLLGIVAVGDAAGLTISSQTPPPDATQTEDTVAEEASPRDEPEERMNVLLISVDTLRRDHLSLYGYERKTTPNLDRFFADGVVFNRATSSAPCTTPSVLQILTGSYDYSFRRPRLAERLKNAGFQTAAFVSQRHFRNNSGPLESYARGFDTFDIQGAHETEPLHSILSARKANRVSDGAIRWLAIHAKTKPFFMWLHYFDPHDPYDPPKDFQQFPLPVKGLNGDRRTHLQEAMKRELATATPERVREIRRMRNAHAHFGHIYSEKDIETLIGYYDGEILYTDYQIHRVLETLRRLGSLERTLVIFTADHGERLGEENRWAHCQSLHAYELDVPLMLSKRGSLPSRVSSAVSTLDVVPTVLDMLDIKYDPSDVSGVNLYETETNRFVYSTWETDQCVQDRKWKLLSSSGGSNGTLSLFDISHGADRQVDIDLTATAPVESMKRALSENQRRYSQVKSDLQTTVNQLKAIGYVQ